MAAFFNKAWLLILVHVHSHGLQSKTDVPSLKNLKQPEKVIDLDNPFPKCSLILNTTIITDISSSPFNCVINVDSKVSMLTGGFKDGELKKTTLLFSLSDQEWSQGPEMIVARDFHVCNSFLHNGDRILIVAGGSVTRTIEFLNYDGLTNEWVQGPSLPDNYNYHFHHLVSYEDSIYYINDFDNVILLLECEEAIDDCHWIFLEQKVFRKN